MAVANQLANGPTSAGSAPAGGATRNLLSVSNAGTTPFLRAGQLFLAAIRKQLRTRSVAERHPLAVRGIRAAP